MHAIGDMISKLAHDMHQGRLMCTAEAGMRSPVWGAGRYGGVMSVGRHVGRQACTACTYVCMTCMYDHHLPSILRRYAYGVLTTAATLPHTHTYNREGGGKKRTTPSKD